MIQHLKKLTIFVYAFCSSVLVFLILNRVRPVQDDYSELKIISQNGLTGLLNENWNLMGGNTLPLILRAISLNPLSTQLNIVGLRIFTFIVVITVLFFGWFIYRISFSKDLNIAAALPLILLLSPEGIFTPGYLGQYEFGAAVVVHFLPIFLFTVFLYFTISRKLPYFLSLILGIAIGNCNLTESLAITLTLFIHFIRLRFLDSKFRLNGEIQQFVKIKYQMLFLNFGIWIGSLIIVIAPGFSNRTNNLVDNEINFGILVSKFGKSFIFFTVDLIQHPLAILGILVGAIISLSINGKVRVQSSAIWVLELFISLYISLIIGSVFAYPAWHQSMTLILLFSALNFVFGFIFAESIKRKINLKTIKTMIVLAILLCISVYVRGLYTINSYGLAWDTSFKTNSCVSKEFVTIDSLKGATTTYPPFELGIEDVDKWPWMATAYLSWISKNSEEFSKYCVSDSGVRQS